jgi:hypothetical protein
MTKTVQDEESLNFISNIFICVSDEFVAQFKSTLLLLPNGTVLCTGIPIDLSLYESEYSVTDEELVKMLAESPNLVSGGSSSKNKKKKKKAASTPSEGDKENKTDTTTAKKE